MPSRTPDATTPWAPLTPRATADLFAGVHARWWISGGVALDLWRGRTIRDRANIDVSTTPADLRVLVESLPANLTAWVPAGGDAWMPWADAPVDADLQPVRIHDERTASWVLQINLEDGTEHAWLYRRDPRLQLPWDRAVLDIDGIPTGAPEVQLTWKALRPRAQDDVDKDAVLPELSDEAQAWFERAILSIHPHSTWSIQVRSPFAPAKPSWNRTQG